MSMRIVTANRVGDGAVVFLGADGEWVESIGAGRLVETDSDIDALLADASAQGGMIDPYAIAVEVTGEGPRPTRYREFIRVFGPTTHPRFAKNSAKTPMRERVHVPV